MIHKSLETIDRKDDIISQDSPIIFAHQCARLA